MVKRSDGYLFDTGRVVLTIGARTLLAEHDKMPLEYLNRHSMGDWGDKIDDHDRAVNQEALTSGARLMSAYSLAPGKILWIITEAEDDLGKRSTTTLLTPDEY